MKQTINHELQQGIAAHNKGNLQEAERIYRTILVSEPLHPDANHNLGVLLVSLNKAKSAISLFKSALDFNPQIEQFWVSYIDTLIKLNKIKDAKKAIQKAKKLGFFGETFDTLTVRLTQSINEKIEGQIYHPGKSSALRLGKNIIAKFGEILSLIHI